MANPFTAQHTRERLVSWPNRQSCVPPPALPLAAAAAINAAGGKTNPIAPPPQEHTARATVSTKLVALLAVHVVAAAMFLAPAGDADPLAVTHKDNV